jgi:signal transduction histidine kinase
MTKSASTDAEVDFMSLVAHQLSAPLAAVRWYAEMLRKGEMAKPLNAAQGELLGEILGAATRMDELVGDLLNASHLEQNKITDKPVATTLAGVVTEQLEALKSLVAAKQLNLTVPKPAKAWRLKVQQSLLQMIVQNLLTNAVKYTADGGSITVTTRAATPEEAARLHPATSAGKSSAKTKAATKTPPPAVTLTVADTGYGIPPSNQPHIFGKFYRADNVRALGIAGSGLGLYIAATAIAKLGGDIWFTSTEQRGSTFFVVLPLSKSDSQA